MTTKHAIFPDSGGPIVDQILEEYVYRVVLISH